MLTKIYEKYYMNNAKLLKTFTCNATTRACTKRK